MLCRPAGELVQYVQLPNKEVGLMDRLAPGKTARINGGVIGTP
jgi:hypothetical protein